MSRATLVLLSALLAPGPAARAGQPQAAASRAEDAAALGFLLDYVDRRVYSLEAAGARRISAAVSVTVRSGRRTQPPRWFDVEHDYQTGQTRTTPREGTPEQAQETLIYLTPILVQFFSERPSRAIREYRVQLAREGDQVRLDYQPRQTAPGLLPFTEYLSPDGTPRRRQVLVPDGSGKGTHQEVKHEFREQDGQLLLLRQIGLGAPGEKLTMDYEYAECDGYRVLRRVRVSRVGVEWLVDFDARVQPPRQGS